MDNILISAVGLGPFEPIIHDSWHDRKPIVETAKPLN